MAAHKCRVRHAGDAVGVALCMASEMAGAWCVSMPRTHHLKGHSLFFALLMVPCKYSGTKTKRFLLHSTDGALLQKARLKNFY